MKIYHAVINTKTSNSYTDKKWEICIAQHGNLQYLNPWYAPQKWNLWFKLSPLVLHCRSVGFGSREQVWSKECLSFTVSDGCRRSRPVCAVHKCVRCVICMHAKGCEQDQGHTLHHAPNQIRMANVRKDGNPSMKECIKLETRNKKNEKL